MILDYSKTKELRVLFTDGTSTSIRDLYPADIYRKYMELKKQDNVEVMEIWHLGNPSYSDPMFRRSRLLRAWEKGKGDLDVRDFCRPVLYSQSDIEAGLEQHLRNHKT